LLDSVISSEIYLNYNGYLSSLRNSIEKPKRQRNNVILDGDYNTEDDVKNFLGKKGAK